MFKANYFVMQSTVIGQTGKLGAPAVRLAAEDHKHACVAVPTQLQPMGALTARE